MSIPEDLLYTREHEWVRIDGGHATVGITDFAVAALGDVVFVGPPAVGEAVAAGQPCGEVESTKTVSDLCAPVGGRVAEVNEDLAASPDLVNSDPYGDGWIFRVELAGSPPELLSAAGYAALVAGS